MYYASDGKTCQHQYGGIGEYISSCSNYNLSNNLKNGNDMHYCSVRRTHYPSNILITNTPQVIRINLIHQIRNQITISCHADYQILKTIKGKLLFSLNGANKEELNKALLNSREICNSKKLERFVIYENRRLKDYTDLWTILHYLVKKILKPKGYILFYQQPNLSKPENSAEHYYQLIVFDEFWLCND
ncbi:15221_t:CDS:2 [Cetraspora pellucida]|uniref:15221_t:CDS:1 n=1 Tax=Cetraspora pellucida TaxID=1433469 RepID=A0A9N9HH21_9GLOM|nr:15221_t:CDS:2 [Cetraspora pellucida]